MKAGIIGAGRQGERRARAIKEAGDELLAVADVDIEHAVALSESYKCRAARDWSSVINNDDIDIIIICTPPDSHELLSLAAFNRGKHVLCEKPLARNVEEAQRMVDSSLINDLKLKCGFNHRHHPGILQARHWFENDRIGEIYSIRCRYGIGGRPDYEKDWRMKPEISGGGQLMDQGMHVIDICRWFLGDFNQIFGILPTSFWDIAPLEDNAFVLMHNEKGQTAQFHVSWTEWKNLFCLEILGGEGYITVEGLGGSYGTERVIMGKRAFLEPFREEIIDFRGNDNSWLNEWREFTSAIAKDREPLGSGNDGLEALKIAQMIYESAQENRRIRTYQEAR